MALYKIGGNNLGRAQSQASGAMKAMGSMTKENQTTEISPGTPPATQIFQQGVGLTGTANQLWNLGKQGYRGIEWLQEKLGAPETKQTAAAAESGAQAPVQAESLNGMQTNSGVQVADTLDKQAASAPDFVNGSGLAGQSAALADATTGMNAASEAALNQAGELASDSLRQQMYATPIVDSPEALSLSADTASKIGVSGPENVTSGLSGSIGPSVGGVAGGLAGKELGRAIGGDTGAAIGGVAGSLGGAYLGGLAMSGLAGGVSGAAGGAAAGAAAGSAVPGLGTFIGAGIGALTSLFL